MPSAFTRRERSRVLVVVERRERRRLGQPVHVEGMARALEIAGELGIGDAVADAQPGEAVDLREGAQHDRAGPPRAATRARRGSRGGARTRRRPRRRRAPASAAATPTKRSKASRADARAGRVVRIADEDELRARRHGARASPARSCTRSASSGTRTRRGAHALHHDRVHRERGPREHALVARPEQHLREQLEDLVGAAPKTSCAPSTPSLRGELAAQVRSSRRPDSGARRRARRARPRPPRRRARAGSRSRPA